LALLDVDEKPVFSSSSVCPGGVPGKTAGICSMPGLWVHLRDGSDWSTNLPQLLACETAESCIHPGDEASEGPTAEECHIWMNVGASNQSGVSRLAGGAKCNKANTGFMCTQCVSGYSKVAGHCVECPGFNWPTLTMAVFINLLTAIFLLHKSAKETISKSEIECIWHKVDIEGEDNEGGYKDGELGQEGVKKVLDLLGVHVKDDEELIKMMEKDFRCVQPKLVVSMEVFVSARARASPTAALSTAIFFVQTFGLVAKEGGITTHPPLSVPRKQITRSYFFLFSIDQSVTRACFCSVILRYG
jgi:hypothetical protein